MYIALSCSGEIIDRIGIILSKQCEDINEIFNDKSILSKYIMIINVENGEKVFEDIGAYPFNNEIRNNWHKIAIENFMRGNNLIKPSNGGLKCLQVTI